MTGDITVFRPAWILKKGKASIAKTFPNTAPPLAQIPRENSWFPIGLKHLFLRMKVFLKVFSDSISHLINNNSTFPHRISTGAYPKVASKF